MLKKSIYWMLNDDVTVKNGLATAFYEYPLIKYLAKSGNQQLPSYFTADNFSQTLIALLRGDYFDHTIPQMELIRNRLSVAPDLKNTVSQTIAIGDETRKYLWMLWVDAGNDIDKFKASLEQWFNDSQDRTTGYYKRYTQWITLIVGLGIAIAGNVNCIAIAHLLLKDKPAREQMVNLAITQYKQVGDDIKQLPTANEADSKAINERLMNDINQVQFTLGLGWGYKIQPDTIQEKKLIVGIKDSEQRFDMLVGQIKKDSTLTADTLKRSIQQIESRKAALEYYYKHISFLKEYDDWGGRILGWLLTAFAISLGAPFWFDLLNKIIQLRGTGPKPVAANTDDGSPATTTVSNSDKRKG
ncbi:hypothetical protein SIO70_02030 [Chitinophaga sancti]|uniref:hypothetical protein n=1 Tax=Chitinophaga sancti TaxID=1004 RepID=UPI002A7626EC|nr:hypothetical protein [Chitinophaga sancti]WPQ63640.1 hypothetical protein SIO70_02030 [Chitinophaga sancti]